MLMEAIVERGGVQVREDDVFREEEPCHGSERVERLGKVETAYTGRLVTEGENEGVARCLEDGEPAGEDKDGDEEEIIAL